MLQAIRISNQELIWKVIFEYRNLREREGACDDHLWFLSLPRFPFKLFTRWLLLGFTLNDGSEDLVGS